MLTERELHLIQWAIECNGLFDEEVVEIGQPGDVELVKHLLSLRLMRRDGEMLVPVVH